ncbi:hypothetical protein GCM10027046_33460 [Uliginosibacterium flavum]|uniref:DUF2782 domain-containing protein n=1 Tax=Uliginosibacterium flavum TaxID=1396831 RepID=A0ABV2TQF5_9RHOO
MSLHRALMMLLCCGLSAVAQAQSQSAPELDRTPVEATTASGDKVRLFPNGRWEFVDAKKAEVAKKAAEAYPENKTRPVDAQGGLFGVGRTIMPGDKDYNRGSLSPKAR